MNFLTVVGLALFLAIGSRGLHKINDRAVAAGESNRNAQVQSDEQQTQYDSQSSHQLMYVTPVEVQNASNNKEQAKPGATNSQADQTKKPVGNQYNPQSQNQNEAESAKPKNNKPS